MVKSVRPVPTGAEITKSLSGTELGRVAVRWSDLTSMVMPTANPRHRTKSLSGIGLECLSNPFGPSCSRPSLLLVNSSRLNKPLPWYDLWREEPSGRYVGQLRGSRSLAEWSVGNPDPHRMTGTATGVGDKGNRLDEAIRSGSGQWRTCGMSSDGCGSERISGQPGVSSPTHPNRVFDVSVGRTDAGNER